mgnify:CR=1 FL=1
MNPASIYECHHHHNCSLLTSMGTKSRFGIDEIMSHHRVIHQYLLLQFIDILSFLFA